MKAELMSKADELKPHICGLFNVRGEKRTCVDQGTPYFSVAKLFRGISQS